MNQFEKLIMEESINICEQLSGLDEGGHSSSIGMSPTRYQILNKPQKEATVAVWAIMSIIAVFIIFLFLINSYPSVDFSKGIGGNCIYLEAIFLQPYTLSFALGDALYEIVLVLGLAFLTTFSSAIIALFLGLWVSRHLAPKHIAKIINGWVVSIRVVPTLVWIVIFAVITGLGSAAVIIGMALSSISYLAKAYSDSLEGLDQSAIEALKTNGVSLMSWTFLRFEINFANLIASVAVVGAGGIRSNSMSTYLVIAFAILLEIGIVNGKIKFPVMRYRKS